MMMTSFTSLCALMQIIWIYSVLWPQTRGETNKTDHYLLKAILGNYTRAMPFLTKGSMLAVDPPYDVIFIFFTFGIGAIIRSIIRAFNLHLPYTILVLFVGGLTGWLSKEYQAFHRYITLSQIEPKYILIAFLPTLVFNTAFSMDYHTFMKSFVQISILAVPGFILSTCLLGIIMKYTFNYQWSWEVSFLFGSIASTCYTQDIVVLLRELGQSKHLSILLEGEALLSEGSALVIFNLLLGYITGIVSNGLHLFILFMKFTIGGPILGFIVGKITTLSLRYLFNDVISNLTLTAVSTYITYYIGEEVLGVSGVLSIVVLGIMISAEKTSINIEVEICMHQFWEFMVFISNTMVFMMAGIIIVEQTINVIEVRDIILAFITYIICNFTRCVMYLTFAPILSHIGYGLTWRNAIIIVWGGIRGALSICLSLIVFRTDRLTNEGIQIIIHVTVLILLTSVINGTTILMLLRFLGMSEISLAKKVNMNNALRHLEYARDKSIGMLKMDRLLADSNWIKVEEGTDIKHPYKIEIVDDDYENEYDDLYMGLRYTTCPDCKKDIPNEPTIMEYKEMLKEAQTRILKAKKVSYWRQFEHGLLSKEAIRILVGAVDIAADRKDPVMEVNDLKASWKQKGPILYIRKKLVEMMAKTEGMFFHPPRQWWRLKYFQIAINMWFEIFMYIVIILNAVPIILEIQVNPASNTPLNIAIKILNNIFFIIYFAEFVIKTLGFGFITYIKSHWNKLDLFVIITSAADLIMDYLDIFTDYDKASSQTSTVITASKFLRLLRLARLCRLIRVSIPKAIAIIDTYIDVNLAQGYDIGKGFVTGEEEVLKLLMQIVDNKKIHNEIKQKVEGDRLFVTKELGLLQRDRPEVAITVKTRQAIRSILNNMKNAVYELKQRGLLDDIEFLKLMEVVEDRLKFLRGHYQMVQPCPPQVLLKEVSWLIGDEEVSDFILEHSILVHFNYGDIIIKEGTMPEGIYILVSGLVKLTYYPNKNTLEKLYNYGILPNADLFTTLLFNENQEDYIVSGNVIGELGVLTNRPYDVTMICDSSVQAYHVTIQVMDAAMKKSFDINQGLRARMWKTIAIRIANVILLDVPTYQSWSQDKIKLHLEPAFVPTLTGFATFVVNEFMDDVLLIEGQFMDANSRITYSAPCYVPRTVQKLIFPQSGSINGEIVETKLLIIPANDVYEYELMENEEQVQFVSKTSSRCLQHDVSRRLSVPLSRKKYKGRVPKRNMLGFNPQRSKQIGDNKLKTSLMSSNSKVFPDPEESTLNSFVSDLDTNQVYPENKDDNVQEAYENNGNTGNNATIPVNEQKMSDSTEFISTPPSSNVVDKKRSILQRKFRYMADLKEEEEENEV